MIVRTLDEAVATRCVRGKTWASRRLLLASDGMGFSLHDTVMDAGTETRMWYKHHVEAVYCIAGQGELLDVDRDRRFPIVPGTMYALDRNDRHVLRALTELRLVCVFNPPLVGTETHDRDGSYPRPTQPPEAAKVVS